MAKTTPLKMFFGARTVSSLGKPLRNSHRVHHGCGLHRSVQPRVWRVRVTVWNVGTCANTEHRTRGYGVSTVPSMPPLSSIRVPGAVSRSAKAMPMRSSAPATVLTDGKCGVTIIIPPVKTAESSQLQLAKDNAQRSTATSSSSPITLDSDTDEVTGSNADLGPDTAGHAATDIDHENDLVTLKKQWCSPLYSFFKVDAVTIQFVDGRLVHFFPCGAKKCKSPVGGVRRYQDSKDKSSTANLRSHAITCFGKEAVNSACGGNAVNKPSGSIHATFTHQGQQPVNPSYRMYTNDEVRAQLVCWIAENNRPINIINDRFLRDLLTAGRPNLVLPSASTISHDL
ncbi:hypothetical protein J3R82DRAFT_9242 [Butyriboletus roseoflavus]|nr:hypothetical protein J3R82DRAFT_9242 [Butyriboletus roseoflavus]